jgi:competence/damage-inducible protein CinA-like protein
MLNFMKSGSGTVKHMPVAEIITIGTELLLGEIQDTNTSFLARSLRDLGVDVYRTTCVGDNSQRIEAVIREALGRSDIVLTTGGLGPTVDDPTRQAVANALGVQLEFHPELWEQVEKIMCRYGRKASENNRRQAWIPAGAEVIPNPVGTAPAFIAPQHGRAVICLPGVPREMELLFLQGAQPWLREQYHLTSVILSRVLHTAGIGESQVDELIGELEYQCNPTVGLLASPGRVDIRIAAKSDSPAEIERMIQTTEAVIRDKLGDAVYGADADTLEDIVAADLARKGLSASLVLHGFGEMLVAKLVHSAYLHVSHQPNPLPAGSFEDTWKETRRLPDPIIALASLSPSENQQVFEMKVKSAAGEKHLSRNYAGPAQMAPAYAEALSLDTIRRLIK